MSFGDLENFGSWSPGDHALNKMVYDKAHKGGGSGGGNNSNSGCAVVFVVIIVIIWVCLFSR